MTNLSLELTIVTKINSLLSEISDSIKAFDAAYSNEVKWADLSARVNRDGIMNDAARTISDNSSIARVLIDLLPDDSLFKQGLNTDLGGLTSSLDRIWDWRSDYSFGAE